MRALAILAPVVLAVLPQSALAASYYGASASYKFSIIGHTGEYPGDVEYRQSWGSSDYHTESFGNIKRTYPGYQSGGIAYSSKDGSDATGISAGHSQVFYWEFYNEVIHSFASLSDQFMTVDILLEYSVAALAGTDKQSPGDYALARAGFGISSWPPSGGKPCIIGPSYGYGASADTRTGKLNESYSGSHLFQVHLDPGTECQLMVNHTRSGEAVAYFVEPAPVPVPASALLLGSALAGLGALSRRRRAA